MTDQQLYLSIGVPSLVALIGILVNVSYFVVLNKRIGATETRLDGRTDNLATRFDSVVTRLSAVESALAAQKVLLDIVLKKLDELESRFHR